MAAKKRRRPRPKPESPEPYGPSRNPAGRPGVAIGDDAALRPRNPALDSLRGLAIVLMIVDHVALLWFEVWITPTTIRFATRAALPLFMVLFGYLLAGKPPHRHAGGFRRLGQIALAAAAVNLLVYPIFRKFEILAGLLLCYAAFYLPAKFLAVLAAAVLLYPLDATQQLLDYPLSILLAMTATGMILRSYGFEAACAAAAAVTVAAAILIPPPALYVMLFLVPAVVAVAVAAARPTLTALPLETIGRYPLTVYTAQYYVIVAGKAAFDHFTT